MNFPNPATMFSGSSDTPQKCTQCHIEFGLQTFKHSCKKCGLTFCDECTQNRCIVPQNELSKNTTSWFPSDILSNPEEEHRKPQRVCYSCYYALRDQQPELRQAVSR